MPSKSERDLAAWKDVARRLCFCLTDYVPVKKCSCRLPGQCDDCFSHQASYEAMRMFNELKESDDAYAK